MSTCKEIQALLILPSTHWSVEERARVEAHQSTCPDCAALAHERAEQDRLIRSLPRIRFTPSQRDQLLSQIQRERKRHHMRTRLSAILSAAAVVAAIVALWLGTRALLPPNSQPALSTTPPVVSDQASPLSLATSIPFTICQASETWTRPSEADQAAQVWDTTRHQRIHRELLWWTFQQWFYRYWGGSSEMLNAWPQHGLWTAKETYTCEGDRVMDLATGHEIELWVLFHHVVAAQRQGRVYTVTVESTPAGYQIVRLPGPGTPDTQVTIRFLDTEGREIERLPNFPPPWVEPGTFDSVITLTGTVMDNAASAQVVTLEDTTGKQWHIPWLNTTVVRRSDGTPAHFEDIQRGMVLDVAGLRRTQAAAPDTLSAIRVTILPIPTPTPSSTESDRLHYTPSPDGYWTAVMDESAGSLDLQSARMVPSPSSLRAAPWTRSPGHPTAAGSPGSCSASPRNRRIQVRSPFWILTSWM